VPVPVAENRGPGGETPGRVSAAFAKAIRAANTDGTRRLPRPLTYLVAVLAVLGATLVRYGLIHFWGLEYPFVSFYPAVALAAWFGGLGPGVLATALSTAFTFVLFLAPSGKSWVDDPRELVALALFVGFSTFISGLIEAVHRTRRRRELALAAVRESEERLWGVVASATDAIITLDSRQRVVLFNAAAESMFRCAAAEIIGKPLDRFIPTPVRERHRDHIRAFGETTGSPRLMGAERVLLALRTNGEEFPIEAHISKMTAGTEKLYTVIVRDVTERKRLEAEREQARVAAERVAQQLQRIQAIMEAALADLPFDQLLQELARRVYEALDADTAVILLEEDGGLRARAAVGLESEFRDHARVPVGEGFAARIATERRPVVWEEINYERGVSGPYLRGKGIRAMAGVPLLSGDGHVLGVLHVDSTRPGKFSDDDVRLLQLAAERVALSVERAARTEAERRARAEAEAANRAKDEFLAMLSHELRNPLAAVRNAVVTAELDEVRRPRALEIARRQTDQLGRLIDDLLDVARVTQGRIALRKARVDLGEVIERALESTRSFIESRGLRLTISLARDPIRIEADPARFEQVLVNLLSNAAKYTEAGGRIDVVAERRGDEVMIRVRDTGIGIAPEILPRIWELFTQADRGLDRAQGGLGIGLTVARRLVELHGGRIDAHSEGLGKGAEFVVTLRALPITSEDVLPGAVAEPAPQRAARVLVVEDNPDTAESVKMLLEVRGHRVRVAYDGVAALHAARASVPDVMLVDIGLPGIDGYEVARRVRRDPDLKRIVLIALTGYGRDEDKEHARAAGFDHHLTKPVGLDALQGLVARFGRDDTKPPTLH
jgi:PAS domain S-box-containing protein